MKNCVAKPSGPQVNSEKSAACADASGSKLFISFLGGVNQRALGSALGHDRRFTGRIRCTAFLVPGVARESIELSNANGCIRDVIRVSPARSRAARLRMKPRACGFGFMRALRIRPNAWL